MSGARGREFFTVSTVSDALAGFRPTRRTPSEVVTLEEAAGRVPSVAVRAAHALPGFARATVDGYAVRAADTYGASDGLPGYLEVLGAVRMGEPVDVALRPGGCVAIPTGGMLPAEADAVVMVEYTEETMPGTIEIHRAVAPGEGVVRADEDAKTGDELVPPGRPLRAHDLGLLAAAGVAYGGSPRPPESCDLFDRRRSRAVRDGPAHPGPGTRRLFLAARLPRAGSRR